MSQDRRTQTYPGWPRGCLLGPLLRRGDISLPWPSSTASTSQETWANALWLPHSHNHRLNPQAKADVCRSDWITKSGGRLAFFLTRCQIFSTDFSARLRLVSHVASASSDGSPPAYREIDEKLGFTVAVAASPPTKRAHSRTASYGSCVE